MKQTETKALTPAEAKAIAVNILHEWVQKFIEHEQKHLTPLIGEDIFKVDGGFKKKYEQEKLKFDGAVTIPGVLHVNAHYYLHLGYDELQLKARVCVMFNERVSGSIGNNLYEDATIRLYEMKNGALTGQAIDNSHYAKRYDAAELVKLSQEIKQAAEAYQKLYYQMPDRFRDIFHIQYLKG